MSRSSNPQSVTGSGCNGNISPSPSVSVTSSLPSEELTFEWRIENFLSLHALAKVSQHGVPDFFTLPFSGSKSQTSWTFYLQVSGENDIGLYLEYSDTENNPSHSVASWQCYAFSSLLNKFTQVRYIVPIVHHKKSVTAPPPPPSQTGPGPGPNTRQSTQGPTWGCSDFVTILYLRQNGYLGKDGVVTLKLNVTILANTGCTDTSPTTSWSWSKTRQSESLKNKLISDYAKMLEDEESSDVTFNVTQDGNLQHVKAHKSILRARSNVFHKMFSISSGMKESVSGEVDIEDISLQGMNLLLKFIYVGDIGNNWGPVVTELIYAAEKYELEHLMAYLDENIRGVLTIQNVMRIRDAAQLFDLPIAKKATGDFIRENLNQFLDNLKTESESQTGK